jgi:hypothetical protein
MTLRQLLGKFVSYYAHLISNFFFNSPIIMRPPSSGSATELVLGVSSSKEMTKAIIENFSAVFSVFINTSYLYLT